VLQHRDLIESGSYENVNHHGQMKWLDSGSYATPPDAQASGRYENLTDSLKHLDSGSYEVPPDAIDSGSGVYDHPGELDRFPWRKFHN
jgi:hypothetical protein